MKPVPLWSWSEGPGIPEACTHTPLSMHMEESYC